MGRAEFGKLFSRTGRGKASRNRLIAEAIKAHGYWSKKKNISVLSRMHWVKDRLAYAWIRREMQPLLSAAEAYFGSWGKALYAAGIDPNLYFVHHKWRKRRAKRSIAGVPTDKQ